jgi:UDP-N-acetylmuramoyl-tripeptide--D-alanyl-D-alanine ligase
MENVKFTQSELKKWTSGTWSTDRNTKIKTISIDTRKIQKDEAYLAICGDNFDGHAFIEQAISKGACAIIAEKANQSISCYVPVLQVENTKQALGDIARNYRIKLNTPIVGITGSSGKTTVKEMVAAILATTYEIKYSQGNLNNDIGLPLSIFQLEKTSQYGIFEIGTNHPDEIRYLADIMQPNIAIITNSGNAHIGNFRTEQAIATEIGEILKKLPENGLAILNKDDNFFDYHKSLCNCKIISVSLNKDADITVKSIAEDMITITLPDSSTLKYKLPLPGRHNITNSMQAIAVAINQNIKQNNICKALKSFVPTGMRWSSVKKNSIIYINDAYNANPYSMRATIETFADLYSPEQSCLILGGMLELGNIAEPEHIALGKFASQFQWKKIILVGQYAKLIQEGLISNGFSKNKILICEKNQEAIDAIKSGYITECQQAFLKASRGFKLEEILNNI